MSRVQTIVSSLLPTNWALARAQYRTSRIEDWAKIEKFKAQQHRLIGLIDPATNRYLP